MKLFRKLKEEKGSITLTVVAAMLFMTAAVAIAYFSLSNKSNNQSRKIIQVAESYKAPNSQLVEKYKYTYDKFIDNLDFSNGLGDINLDNMINSIDVNLINSYINEIDQLTGIKKVRADINKDKIIDAKDVALLQEKVDENNNS